MKFKAGFDISGPVRIYAVKDEKFEKPDHVLLARAGLLRELQHFSCSWGTNTLALPEFSTNDKRDPACLWWTANARIAI